MSAEIDALRQRAQQEIERIERDSVHDCGTWVDGNGDPLPYCPSCNLLRARTGIIRDLLAALEAQQGGWQDISTAPKDGTPVLLWWPYWANARPLVGWWQNNGGWQSWEAADDDAKPPTHWMPLPELPR